MWKQLDAIDKAISTPLFALRLPVAILEFFLSLPGNFFGSCSFTLILCPSLVGIALEGGTEISRWHILIGALLVCHILLWHLLLSSKKDLSNDFARRYFYGPLTVALGPIVGVSLLAVSPLSTFARQMGYFQMCAWSTGVLPTAILKPLVGRERPASWILNGDDSRLQQAVGEKHIPALPRLFAKDSYESMPSGDTAGAVGCMYLFLRSENSLLGAFGMLCIALSCLGRMYWMAHHFLDVCVGVLTSLVACTMLQTRFCNDDATECFVEWWNPIVIHSFVLSTVVAPKWYKKKPTLYAGTLRMDDSVENELVKGD
eukprot:scaffold22653_cov119-Cylindrotheca_fusiformis.AAC.3